MTTDQTPDHVSRQLAATPKAKLIDMLYQMLLGRRYEEKCAEMYALQKIGGFCHLYIGQEAVAIGALSTLRPDDLIITAYREHVHALVKGCDPGRVMAELFGRRDGVSRGKGGSMHLFDREKGMLGGHGIVGAQRRERADRHRLLADVQVAEAADLLQGIHLGALLFVAPPQQHLVEHVGQLGLRRGGQLPADVIRNRECAHG